MEIVKYPNPILSTALSDFDFENPPIPPAELATELLKYMYKTYGVGLSSNQLGLPYRVFAMRGYPVSFVCFNPKIVYYNDKIVSMEEACLSFPGITIKIKRPSEIRARFQTPSGMVVTKKFEGLTARTFQHEMDHMDGTLFFNRANRYHREKALKGYNNGRN